MIICEFHDDVAVLDAECNPTSIAFAQVKTLAAGKRWTRAALLKRKKSRDGAQLPSILGKLYANLLGFLPHVSRLTFVSNGPCSLKRADGTTCEKHAVTTFDLLETSELDEIRKSINAEHGLPSFPGGESFTAVELTSLPVNDHCITALGRTTEFLEQHHPTDQIPPAAFYRSLQGEVERRCTREARPASVQDLIKSHGISRAEFTRMLAGAAAITSAHPLSTRIEARLNSEHADFIFTRDLTLAVRRYSIERMDPRADLLREAALEAAALATSVEGVHLQEILDGIRIPPRGALENVVTARGLRYAQGILAVAVYEANSHDNQLSSTRPPSEDQTA